MQRLNQNNQTTISIQPRWQDGACFQQQHTSFLSLLNRFKWQNIYWLKWKLSKPQPFYSSICAWLSLLNCVIRELYFWSFLLVNCLQTIAWVILKKRILTAAQVLKKSWLRWLFQTDLPKHLDMFTTSVRSCKLRDVFVTSVILIFSILDSTFLSLILYLCKSY